MNKKTLSPSDYKSFFLEIKNEILESQKSIIKTINTQLVQLYFEIGKMISEKIELSDWWKAFVENLSKDLKNEFPWIKGFSERNIWYMIKFYKYYNWKERLQPLVAEISWSNNILILEKCENDFQREYYLKLCKKTHLSKRVLQHKIEWQEFERVLTSDKTHNFDLTLEEEHAKIVKNTLKDSYIFDFLSLWEEHSEKELEQNLLENFKKFILELWIWFAFIGSQYAIYLEWEEYFLDLLFYHTQLKCYVVVELKVWKFLPEYAGKLNFYLNLLDDTLKNTDDNPTIWILICKDKNKKTVEYSLKNIEQSLVVSEYSLKKLDEKFQKALPSEQDISDFLDRF